MATKHFCDRCNAVINPVASHTFCRLTTSPFDYDYTMPHELCVSCAFKLKKFLDGKAEIVVKDGDNNGR